VDRPTVVGPHNVANERAYAPNLRAVALHST
jgi:hypothetical protein